MNIAALTHEEDAGGLGSPRPPSHQPLHVRASTSTVPPPCRRSSGMASVSSREKRPSQACLRAPLCNVRRTVEAATTGCRRSPHAARTRLQPKNPARLAHPSLSVIGIRAVQAARGQDREPGKAHKLHLASDRTSCSKATANQFRLLVHTAACWLTHTLRDLTPKLSFWRDAQFDTFRLGLIKVAGRVTEMATRIKVALPSAFPYQTNWGLLVERTVRLPP